MLSWFFLAHGREGPIHVSHSSHLRCRMHFSLQGVCPGTSADSDTNARVDVRSWVLPLAARKHRLRPRQLARHRLVHHAARMHRSHVCSPPASLHRLQTHCFVRVCCEEARFWCVFARVRQQSSCEANFAVSLMPTNLFRRPTDLRAFREVF